MLLWMKMSLLYKIMVQAGCMPHVERQHITCAMWRDSSGTHLCCSFLGLPRWQYKHALHTHRDSKDDEQDNICLGLINWLFLVSADENEVTGYIRCFSKTEDVSNCFHNCSKCPRKTTWNSVYFGSPLVGLVHNVTSGKSWQKPAWGNYLRASTARKRWTGKANPTLAFFLLSPESQHMGSSQSQNWSFFLN